MSFVNLVIHSEDGKKWKCIINNEDAELDLDVFKNMKSELYKVADRSVAVPHLEGYFSMQITRPLPCPRSDGDSVRLVEPSIFTWTELIEVLSEEDDSVLGSRKDLVIFPPVITIMRVSKDDGEGILMTDADVQFWSNLTINGVQM